MIFFGVELQTLTFIRELGLHSLSRFANKHIEKTAASQRDKEVLVITVNTKDDLISVKFYDFHKKNRNGILITREKSDQVVSEKKNFVVFDNCEGSFKTYIIDGESGHFREVESIEAPYSRLDNLVDCYVPSSVQI
ncbi:unnamed protein product [Brassica napus]|uniref:(rape) hypothetical protein n=1 Tax=Brassica napus TaxID=3708 RepID=A0A816TS12_BRANA|nr:unnamed protein product [Brassica napus]